MSINLVAVATVAMSGIKGQIKLTTVETGFTYDGLIVGAKTNGGIILVSGEQFNKTRDDSLEDYADRSIADNNITDIVNIIDSTWTVTSGEVILYLG